LEKNGFPEFPKQKLISKSLKSHSNDPLFSKKADDLKKLLEKAGLPELPKDKK